MAARLASDVISRIGVSKAAASGIRHEDLAREFLPATRQLASLRSELDRVKSGVRNLKRAIRFVPLDPAAFSLALKWRAPASVSELN